MNYKKIALFFLVLFSFNQILPMEKASAWFFSFFAVIIMGTGCAIGLGVTLSIIAIKEKIDERMNNFLKFDFFKTELKKNQINHYIEEFKTACLNKDMKTLKNLLEQNYYILKNNPWCWSTPTYLVQILQDPYYYTVQTPFFIACNEENEEFLRSLTLKANDSADFFKINDYAKLFLVIAIENNQEKVIELLLKYSTWDEKKIYTGLWKVPKDNAIIKLFLRYQFNNISLKTAWCFDNLNKNKELANIILDSLQYLTNKDQQLDFYMRAIINGDSEISNTLTALYKIDFNSSYQDDKATTGYQKLLFIYLIMCEKNEQNYNDYWAFNDITIAKNNIEDIFSNQINNQNDKLALMDYLPEVCSRKEFNMAKILLSFNDSSLNSQTLFNIVLNQCSDSAIAIINILLDDYRITNFKCESSEYKRNINNQTFFYSFYEKFFKQKSVEKFNEINYVNRKINDKKFINSELQSAATILFNDEDAIVKRDYYGDMFNLNCFTAYIDFCLANGGDLTQRDKNNKLPLDYAHEQYDGSFKYMSVNSMQFWIKEKIYHIFLSKTPCIQEKELYFLLLNNKIPKDCVNLIMHYNFINNIDRYIAKSVNNDNYYGKVRSTKKETKKTIISKKREELTKLFEMKIY